METLKQDVRYGLRMLAKSPGFTAVAVLTLALGIGVNTAIFSIFNQVLLRSLPVRNPDQLVILSSPGDKQGHVYSDKGDGAESFSYPMYKDLRDHNDVFTGLLARFGITLNISFQGQTERATGELVSGNYFQTLGVRAVLGRTFTDEDDITPGAHTLAVLSHNFWSRRFASDPAILNQTMTINGQVMTIIGVAQAGFTGVQVGQTPDIFIPITMKAQMTPNWDGLADRKDYWLNIIGRLKDGVSSGQAAAGLAPLYHSLLENELPLQGGISRQAAERFTARPISLEDGSRGRQILQADTSGALVTLMLMVAFVLLITCANLASLLITRAISRQKEIAVRQALGASRWRLVRQLMVESLVLSLAGGLLGLLVAVWTISGLLQLVPPDQGMSGLSTDLDRTLLAFNFALAVLTGILFGLIPALRATRTNLVSALKEQGKHTAGAAHAGLRKGLVITEVALTVVLLITAGLFARSLYNLRRVDVGIRADRILAFSISPELNGYTPARSVALFDQMREGIASLPGVEMVSSAQVPVFAGNSMGSNCTIEGYTPSEGEDMHVFRNNIGPAYFATMGIPLIAGREFTAEDTARSQKVAIISESVARTYFGERNPIGRRMKFGAGQGPLDLEIVGVVKDSKHGNVRETPNRYVYNPYTQRPAVGEMTFYVRTAREPERMAATLREEVARLDASLPIFNLRTLREQIDESIFGDRFMAMLSSAFGVLAALLAAIGIYGVMAYSVTQRTQEIGIRVALGAQPGNVLRMIVRQGMTLAGIGLGIGLAGAIALMRPLSDQLFNVSANDPVTFAAVALLLAAVAMVACYIPARRATRVDPMVALRYE
ncbi:MAG: ABC transporter permease [Acidobacteriota bacterium]